MPWSSNWDSSVISLFFPSSAVKYWCSLAHHNIWPHFLLLWFRGCIWSSQKTRHALLNPCADIKLSMYLTNALHAVKLLVSLFQSFMYRFHDDVVIFYLTNHALDATDPVFVKCFIVQRTACFTLVMIWCLSWLKTTLYLLTLSLTFNVTFLTITVLRNLLQKTWEK